MIWLTNVLSSYIRFALAALILFFVTPYVVAQLGMDNYGIWAIAISIMGVIGLGDFGLATAAVKFLAQQTLTTGFAVRRNQVFTSLCLIATALASVTFLATVFLVFNLTGQGEVTLHIVFVLGCACSISLLLSIYKAVLCANSQQYLVNWVAIFCLLIQALLTIVFIELGYGLKGLAYACAANVVAQQLLLIPICYHNNPDLKFCLSKDCWQDIKQIQSFAIFAFIANIALLVILRLDPLLIAYFCDLQSVAVFAIAAKLSEQLYLFNKQLSNALMPLVSRLYGNNNVQLQLKGYQLVLINASRYLLAFSLPIQLFLIYYAELFIVFWMGPEFREAVLPLRILLCAGLISSLQFNAANILGMTQHHRLVAKAMLCSALANLALSCLLIPPLGLAGAALATLIASCIFETMWLLPKACRYTSVTIKLFVQQVITPCFAVSAIGLCILAALPTPASIAEIIVNSLLAGILTLVAFILFATDRQEMVFLKRYLQRLKEKLTWVA